MTGSPSPRISRKRVSSVVLVDDHPVVLEGLRELVRTVGELAVVGAYTSGADAIAAVGRDSPDLVILDLRLPDLPGPEVCRRLKEAAPSTKILVFTAFDDPGLLQACAGAGADGILLKDQGDIVSSIRAVLRGERVVDERLALAAPDGERAPPTRLTARELEVLALLAEGMTSRAIAESLHLAPNTVRGYVQSILTKLGARNRIQALSRARELGLLP